MLGEVAEILVAGNQDFVMRDQRIRQAGALSAGKKFLACLCCTVPIAWQYIEHRKSIDQIDMGLWQVGMTQYFDNDGWWDSHVSIG